MKTLKSFAVPIIFTSLIASVSIAFAAGKSETELMKEAKITKDIASQTALSKVPSGVIKSSELEKEHGRLIWSFDISKPSSNNITEVNVDAKTGKVVQVKNETPAKEKAEAIVEKAEKTAK